jgi:hypothetical protein
MAAPGAEAETSRQPGVNSMLDIGRGDSVTATFSWF